MPRFTRTSTCDDDHPAPDLLATSVYGLPEVYRSAIKNAMLVASPGCYPTSVLLPVLPLLRAGLIKPAGIIADSLSGVSGAGRKVEQDYLFVECNESVRPYGVPKHRHLSEIEQELSLAAGTPVVIQFTPHLIPVNRGILTTMYLAPANHFSTAKEAAELERKDHRLLSGRLCQRAVRAAAGRQGAAGHQERGRHQCHRNRLAARPAHRAARGDERGRQYRQRRQRPGRAKPEHHVRLLPETAGLI